MNSLSRKLGLIENLFNIVHDLGGLIDVNVARIQGLIKPEILQQALDLVQKRHPMLQVHIVKLEDGAYFQSEGTTKIPLHIIDRQNENQWLEVVEDELHQKFPNNTNPLCRVTLLRSSISHGIHEIFMTFHHAIIDGMSCMYFLEQLCSYYRQIALGECISEVVTMKILPPLENLLDSHLVSKNNLEEAIDEKRGADISHSNLIIEGEASPDDRRSRLIPKSFSQEMTLMLKKRCQEENTTVHGALCAAMLFGYAKIIFSGTPIDLVCSTSVNLRKYCQPEIPDNYMGCLVSSLEEIHRLELNTDFWDLARECKAKIINSLNDKIPIKKILSKQVATIDEQIIVQLSEQKRRRNNPMSISNRGRFLLDKSYGNFTIKELYFAVGQHLLGDCFWLGVVTINEQLFCSFIHPLPLVSAKTADFFADSVMKILDKGSTEQDFQFRMLQKVS